MSKMGQHIVREAESASTDHASELAELRAEVARLEGVIRRAAGALEPSGPTPLVDVHAWLGRQAQFPMARAVRDAGEAVVAAREILAREA